MTQKLALFGGKSVRSTPFPSWPVYGKQEEDRLIKTLKSGKWGRLDGQEVPEFERRFAAYQGARHGLAVANGTVAIRIALLAAGIKADDEVIVPPYTFLATATAVVESNAIPVFTDIELETFNIDPRAVEKVLTPRTRAIIPVHIGGLPANMDAIMDIAKKHNLIVIEDAAHAHGAEYKGRRIGSIGHMGIFSFQSSKNLTSGEGGFITSSDDALAGRCRSIHNCGRAEGGLWYEHHLIAGNYRLGEFQGAILNSQMDRLEKQAQTRDTNGKNLSEKLAEIPGVIPQKRNPDCTRHGYHLYLFRINPEKFGASRDQVVKAVQAEGVPVCGGYPLPLYRQPLFLNKAFGPYIPNAAKRMDYGSVRCPNCEKVCYEQGGWMTQNLLLGKKKDMDDIIRAFSKVYENREELMKAL